GALVAVALLAISRVGGGVTHPVAAAVIAIAATAAGYTLPDERLRRAARRRRSAIRHTLSSYLDLVSILLAGGAGMETALCASAEAGQGWAFDHIRAALVSARTT